MESVIEAAQYNQQYQLDSSIKLVVENDMNSVMRVEIKVGESIEIGLSKSLDSIQWRSSDLRHDWTNIHSYHHEEEVYVTYEEIVHELEHLPNIELEGKTNHTISVRGLDGSSSSTILSINILLNDEIADIPPEETGSQVLIYGSIIASILLTIILLAGILKTDEDNDFKHYDDDDEIAVAELVE